MDKVLKERGTVLEKFFGSLTSRPQRPSAASRRRWSWAILPLAGMLLLSACGSSGGSGTGSNAGGPVTLSLVAYSTPKSAFAKLIAAFEKTSAGKRVGFEQSYGPSGSQATAVVDGLPADVVNFSLEPDMAKLVKASLVRPDWDRGKYRGMVTDSVVVFIVRKGNPKGIASWADLVKPGVKVVTPNPFSSGSARWNIMAAYGSAIESGDTPSQAHAYLKQLLSHVAAQPSSASTALTTFLGGSGDVLLDYEDDAIAAQKKGEPVDYVVPAQTILIENPIAVLKSTSHPKQASAFVDFLLSPQGQKLWAKAGYRPVDAAVAAEFDFPHPAHLFTIKALGGWSSVTKKFFDPQAGAVTKIEQQLGVNTAKG